MKTLIIKKSAWSEEYHSRYFDDATMATPELQTWDCIECCMEYANRTPHDELCLGKGASTDLRDVLTGAYRVTAELKARIAQLEKQIRHPR